MIYKRQKKSRFRKNFERAFFDLVNNSRLGGG